MAQATTTTSADSATSTTMSAAEAAVVILEQMGVDRIWGIPGAAILPVFDAIHRRGNIDSYVVRHEQTAVFAADGWARITGQPGVCMVTSGPASTNLATGLYGALFDRIPLIAFTGQVNVALLNHGAFQEAPTPDVVRSVTKAVFQPHSGEEIVDAVYNAWRIATEVPMGPVLIDLPLDVQLQNIDFTPRQPAPAPALARATDDEVNRAADMILAAERPAILAGGGIILADAADEFRALIETTGLPAVLTYMGRGAIPADHPLYAGAIGTSCNTPLGNELFNAADLIVNLGGRFADRSVGLPKDLKEHAKIVHVNINPEMLGLMVDAELGIAADVKDFLPRLQAALVQRGKTIDDYKTCDLAVSFADRKAEVDRRTEFDSEFLKPQQAIAMLRIFLDRDAIVTHDCGVSQMWSGQFFEIYEPRTYLVTGGAGTMGWGLGAAIGAKMARPEAQVVNLLGDGSIGMALADLATLAHHDIGVVVCVINNGWLGLIRHAQDGKFGERRISTDLTYGDTDRHHVPGIDFVKTAEGLGVAGEAVTDAAGFDAALERAFAKDQPYLIEIAVDRDAKCSMSGDGSLNSINYYTE